jgi:hypothetical protein
MLSVLGKYAKAVTAVAGAALTVSVAVWGTSNHWVVLATTLATALGVYVVPNAKAVKTP